ncbi:uncharacterized protein LOC124811837 [Hydra vulgaris]|uniref:uncharacterized protein LOC124811837 n=1 Tax=Hydra vulgaris TaxID=6087 RepID=UPI0032EA7781
MGICEKHWPLGCSMHYPKRSKYEIPSDPPTIFPGCASSILRHTGTTFCSTNFAEISMESRNLLPDKLSSFNKIDHIESFEIEQFLKDIKQRFPDYFVTTSISDVIILM